MKEPSFTLGCSIHCANDGPDNNRIKAADSEQLSFPIDGAPCVLARRRPYSVSQQETLYAAREDLSSVEISERIYVRHVKSMKPTFITAGAAHTIDYLSVAHDHTCVTYDEVLGSNTMRKTEAKKNR